MANYLYNGVVLPELPEWDREAYPYAVIGYYVDVILGEVRPYAYLFCFAEPLRKGRLSAFVTDNVGTKLVSKISLWRGETNWSNFEVEEYGTDLAQEACALSSPFSPLTWSNHDILNGDGTLYLSSTTPISLANQTVIEWDGDTEGLESTTRSFTTDSGKTETLTFYKVSDVVPSVKQVEGGYYVIKYYNAGTRFDGNNINYLTSDGFVVSGGTDDTFCNVAVLVNSEGVWLNKIEYADNADGDHYTSVFTYLTAAPEVDPTSWLSGYLMGCKAREMLKKKK